jgi:hypothetical protein
LTFILPTTIHIEPTKKTIPAKPILDVTHRYVEHKHRRVQFLPWNMVLNVLNFSDWVFTNHCTDVVVMVPAHSVCRG